MYNGGESSKGTFVLLKEMTSMVVREAWQQGGGVITIFSCVSTKVHPTLKAYAFPFPLIFPFSSYKRRVGRLFRMREPRDRRSLFEIIIEK
jgi:hypothetical protein